MSTSKSRYLVFIDESGDHSLHKIDPNYPVFALVCCVISKEEYINNLAPSLLKLKIDFSGHDNFVIHERDLVKKKQFGRSITDSEQKKIMQEIANIVSSTKCKIISAVIDKHKLTRQYVKPSSPYDLALKFCLERIHYELISVHNLGSTYIICESRGTKEDSQLQSVFRSICSGDNATGRPLPFELSFATKDNNILGLQFVDLLARPIGLRFLRPKQANQAADLIWQKLRKDPAGKPEGWGLKIFP